VATRRGDMTVDRLSLRTLSQVPPSRQPRIDPRGLGVGIVHLGIGAFHRAHQAEFTEDAVAARGGDWGICGVTQRSPSVVAQLMPQDGLYTLVTRGPSTVDARVIGAVRAVLFAGSDPVAARLADPAVRVVTLTVTEKGYRHDPASGRLRVDDPVLRADLAGDAPPRTVVGQIVRGLEARMRRDAGPVTVVSCDNLAHNGRTLAGLVDDFVTLVPAGRPLASWIAENVRFPSSMVDRIVPATTPADHEDVRRLIGLDDEGAVVTEPFRQWVIEDDFPAGRPAWDAAGALFTDDVTPYEVMKLRMLNGAHSALAYLGALAGCETIATTMAHEAFAIVAQRLIHDDARPTLDPPPAGIDLDEYERQLLERFANPALRHRTVQIAMDGSQKLPQRLLSTLRARRVAGESPRWAALAVAAWMRWVSASHTDVGAPRVLDDPLAPVLQQAVSGSASAADVVDRLLGVREVFGDDLRDDPVVRALLTDALEQLAADGALAAAAAAVKGAP
jgi:fructuronate reductase